MSKTVKTQRYHVKNWSKYNDALVQRGSLTLYFSEAIIKAWEHHNASVKVGRPFVYSDLAIESLLMIREAFQLPYRQTEGFASSIVQLMDLELEIPDYSSLCKRAKTLAIDIRVKNKRGPLNVVVDSTGLKVYGEGEWKVRKHGPSKRRTWRKLHLAIDPQTQEIIAMTLTENKKHDGSQVEPLLKQIPQPIKTFTGDGAYDQKKVFRQLQQANIQPLIPPRRNAKIMQHGNSQADPHPRDAALRRIREIGRKAWKIECGYHQRSLAETGVYRIKNGFGGELKNRLLETQETEVEIRTKIINKYTNLGMPDSTWS